eukprot:9477550-Pyramimonas_sp.AAC.1
MNAYVDGCVTIVQYLSRSRHGPFRTPCGPSKAELPQRYWVYGLASIGDAVLEPHDAQRIAEQLEAYLRLKDTVAVNARDEWGRTPLHWAAQHDQVTSHLRTCLTVTTVRQKLRLTRSTRVVLAHNHSLLTHACRWRPESTWGVGQALVSTLVLQL